MMQKRFILLALTPVVLPGCAGLYQEQYPAPVYVYQPPVYQQPMRVAPQARPQLPPPRATVKTTPIPEFKPRLTPIPPAPSAMPPLDDMPPLPNAGTPAIGGNPSAVAPALSTPAPAPEQHQMAPFQPIEPSASVSPAVGALVSSANQSSQTGRLDSAIATIERARSIEPNNAGLYYKLALLRLKQSKPKQAEELAKRAALLAVKDRHLKKHSWLLIAHARELQKDFQGAKAARDKADRF